MPPRNDDRTARQIARKAQRNAGDTSARLAAALMKLPDTSVDRLVVEDGLRDAIARARAVTSNQARRRAERTLAGDLRRFELDDVEAQIDKVAESEQADARKFQQAERWRTQLIDGADPATFPGGTDDDFPRLIEAARRERDTGRPPGAARALFRHIVKRLGDIVAP